MTLKQWAKAWVSWPSDEDPHGCKPLAREWLTRKGFKNLSIIFFPKIRSLLKETQ